MTDWCSKPYGTGKVHPEGAIVLLDGGGGGAIIMVVLLQVVHEDEHSFLHMHRYAHFDAVFC
jgi:hypothetical protein